MCVCICTHTCRQAYTFVYIQAHMHTYTDSIYIKYTQSVFRNECLCGKNGK